MSFTSLAAAAKALARAPGAVRRLDLARSEDLQCRNIMCEKLGEACACRLARFLQQSREGLAAMESLDLSGSGLRAVPTAVFECGPQLRELALRDNGMTDLPEEVRLLEGLEELDLAGNKLEQLPVEALNALPRLRVVRAAGNSPGLAKRAAQEGLRAKLET